MKAKEMFEELGYELIIKRMTNGGKFDNGYYYKYTQKEYKDCDGKTNEYITKITFANKKQKSESFVIFNSSDDENGFIREATRNLIDYNEFKAIQKQIEELGWYL